MRNLLTAWNMQIGGGDPLAIARTWQEPLTAIILAGGRSERAGRDKSMMPIDGQPMIEHVLRQLRPLCEQVLVSADDAGKYGFLGVEVVQDEVPGQGPLMGIASAVEVSLHDLNFVVACDIPDISIDFVGAMLREADGFDGVVPLDAEGRPEPLFAVYRKSMLPAMRRVLSSGHRHIRAAFSLCRMTYVELGEANWLRNLNSLEDYESYLRTRGFPRLR